MIPLPMRAVTSLKPWPSLKPAVSDPTASRSYLANPCNLRPTCRATSLAGGSKHTSALALLFAVLMGISTFSQAQAESAPARYNTALQSWQNVLEKFVDDRGRTDFIALASDAGELRRFVAFVAATSPESDPELFSTPQSVLAYHINAYNALAMLGVIDAGIPDDFDSFFKRTRFFRFRSVVVGGKKTSLHQYENQIIRPLGDPRAHFALNCMVRDCPRLPTEPFSAAALDQQLELATREFFRQEQHLRVDDQQRTVYLSAILDFYTEDFVSSGKPEDLIGYVNRYLKNPVPEAFRVKFNDYDWTINQPTADGAGGPGR